MARQVVVELIGDNKRLTKSFDGAAASSEGFGSRVGKATKVAALAFAAVGAAAVAAGVTVFNQGAQFEAMDNKAQTVFGSSLKAVEQWAASNAAAMGLTKREATGLAASMGDLLVPMGFTRDQAAEMSTDIVGLSGALSEWSGGTRSAAEVSTILQKALLGEREGLKELGISITEADVQARLAANGTDKLTGAALQQAKALATQELIMEKSTDAQAAFTEGQAEGLRTSAELGAMFKEIMETVITGLYPAVLTVATFFKDTLPPAIETARAVFDGFRPTLENIGATVLPMLSSAMNFITSTVVPAFGQVFKWITENVVPPMMAIIGTITGTVLPILGQAFSTVVKVVKDNWPAISNIVGGVASAVKIGLNVVMAVVKIAAPIVKWLAQTIFPILGAAAGVLLNVLSGAFSAIGAVWQTAANVGKTVVNAIKGAWRGLTSFFTTLWRGITGAVKGGINFVIGAINGMIGLINGIQIHIPRIGVGPVAVGPFDWWGLNLGRIPYLHAGGVVPGVPGADVLTVLQAGERVIPRSQAGGGGITINIENFNGSDAELDRLCDKIAMRLRLQGV